MGAKRIHLIACGVLKLDMPEIFGRLGVEYDATYLDGGLHADPARLRRELQGVIDSVDEGPAGRIIIGYGLCGRGTVGIRARSKPLVIPRVHDCIALFLGADSAYRREFAKCPGTYYISAGWYDEKVQPRGTVKHADDPRDKSKERMETRMLAEKYGEDNAREIQRFMSSWKRNYRRAAYIDTGTGSNTKYEDYARAMADAFGWEYERLEGNSELLERAITADARSNDIGPDDTGSEDSSLNVVSEREASDGSDAVSTYDDILIVPPGFVTSFDAKSRKIAALPESEIVTRSVKSVDETAGSAGADAPPTAFVYTSDAATSRSFESEDRHASEPEDNFGPGDEMPEYDGEHSIGIGIDTGGTYTDAVIFDMKRRDVLASGKALTTKWNYTEGITEALGRLESKWFKDVDLVSVSTTLATNAIVEGSGQKTGLVLMPHGFVDLTQFDVPTVIVPGRIDISGNEIEPIDDVKVAESIVEMRRVHGIQAFAVSGYAGSLNPSHEIAVKRIIESTTGCDVCCGHELSDRLDFFVRANTAVLNAGIIPLLERFIEDVNKVLEDLGITAPVMVVKGDGTLMQASYAREHPVETILSGPAASIAGARYITRLENATVVDVGGTTSDIGKITEGIVRIRKEGAEVGAWRTHVQAVDMRTIGLGGDSEVCIDKQVLLVGPRRIAPVCWLASRWPAEEREREFRYLEERIDDFAVDTRLAELLWSTGRSPSFALNEQELKVLEALESSPLSILHLVERADAGHPILLRTERLESEHIVQRCGLTPTDLLHTAGVLDLWDADVARRYARIVSAVTGESVSELATRAMHIATRKLTYELVRRQLDHGEELSAAGDSQMLDVLLDGGNRHIRATLELNEPIVGLGAAARLFLEPVISRLEAKLVTPPYADVANAVGAITSMVVVSRIGSIVPAADGAFHLTGLSDMERYTDFETAHKRLIEALDGMVKSDAQAAGTEERQVDFEINDRMSATADGMELFLARDVVASISGPPSNVRS